MKKLASLFLLAGAFSALAYSDLTALHLTLINTGGTALPASDGVTNQYYVCNVTNIYHYYPGAQDYITTNHPIGYMSVSSVGYGLATIATDTSFFNNGQSQFLQNVSVSFNLKNGGSSGNVVTITNAVYNQADNTLSVPGALFVNWTTLQASYAEHQTNYLVSGAGQPQANGVYYNSLSQTWQNANGYQIINSNSALGIYDSGNSRFYYKSGTSWHADRGAVPVPGVYAVYQDAGSNNFFLGTNLPSNWTTNQSPRSSPVTDAGQIISGVFPPARLPLGTDFNTNSGLIQVSDSLKIVPDGVTLTLSNSTMSTPAAIPGPVIELLNTNLTDVFTNSVFSLTNRLVLGVVESYYGSKIGGFVSSSALSPENYMLVEVSSDGGATWDYGATYKTSVLVSIYDPGAGNDTCTNLIVYGYKRPSLVGATNDFVGQFVLLDDAGTNSRSAVNVSTATSIANQRMAFWANNAAVGDVNLNSHSLNFSKSWSQGVNTNGQWFLADTFLGEILSVKAGSGSGGNAPVIESLAVTTNLLFTVLADSQPYIQQSTNLSDWVLLSGQSSYYSNSLYWVSAPIPPEGTNALMFRAYVNGSNMVPSTVALAANVTIPQLTLTNLTLSVTSAPPSNPSTPVVWFTVTNAGVAYKIGGFQ